jgi:cellulose synthase/poly-beta-1,6-N-acetylglucosamine synthase-like glycosyltransferase
MIPAHNEASVIGTCLASLWPQLGDRDRILVIADNCEDDTAAVARLDGAVVIERHAPNQRGKGYALDYGVQFVAANPPDVIVVMDADCIAQDGLIDKIATLALASGRPVQAAYILHPPSQPEPKAMISTLAFIVKNVVRPRGLERLGLPCLLTGTGMAFPWPLLARASLASGKTAEDMRLAIDLALAGHAPTFCGDVSVTGYLSKQERILRNQRTLWEHGHLDTLFKKAPRLLKAALRQRCYALFAMALDVCLPPLSLLMLLWAAASSAAVLAGALTNRWGPATILAIAGLQVWIAVITAWARFGRRVVPVSALCMVPAYMIWKIPLYLTFLISRQTEWVLREREIKRP